MWRVTFDGRIAEFARLPILIELFLFLFQVIHLFLHPKLDVVFILLFLQFFYQFSLRFLHPVIFAILDELVIVRFLTFDCLLLKLLEEMLKCSKLSVIERGILLDFLTDHLNVVQTKSLLLKFVETFLNNERVHSGLCIKFLITWHDIWLRPCMTLSFSVLLQLM